MRILSYENWFSFMCKVELITIKKTSHLESTRFDVAADMNSEMDFDDSYASFV